MLLYVFIWVAQAGAIVINILFLINIANRQPHSQICFFLQHSVAFTVSTLLLLFFNLLFVANPLFMTRNQVFSHSFTATVIWAAGAYVYLCQHFGIVVLAWSRTVALTFKTHFHLQLWGPKVTYFAMFIHYVFPLMFVTSFVLDGPRIVYDDNTNELVWNNTKLYGDFEMLKKLITYITYSFAFLGMAIGLTKRCLLRVSSPSSRGGYDISNRERVVHTVRAASDTPSGSLGTPQRPSTLPVLSHKEVTITLIVVVTALANLCQSLLINHEYATHGAWHLIVVSLCSVVFPILLKATWELPLIVHKLKNDRGCICRMYRRLAGPTMREVSLHPVGMMPTDNIAAIYHPRRSTISGVDY